MGVANLESVLSIMTKMSLRAMSWFLAYLDCYLTFRVLALARSLSSDSIMTEDWVDYLGDKMRVF